MPRISGNGTDTEDTATPGPPGINVSGGDNGTGTPVAVITGTVIAGNVIQQETIGVATKTSRLGSELDAGIYFLSQSDCYGFAPRFLPSQDRFPPKPSTPPPKRMH